MSCRAEASSPATRLRCPDLHTCRSIGGCASEELSSVSVRPLPSCVLGSRARVGVEREEAPDRQGVLEGAAACRVASTSKIMKRRPWRSKTPPMVSDVHRSRKTLLLEEYTECF
jgi:hypothetical protein